MSTAAHAGGRAELNISRSTFGFTLGLAAMLMLVANSGVRAQQSTQDLAAAAHNPVAAMYSPPFQDNIYGGVGPAHNATGNVLNIQPVKPITVGDWNIISRTIAPLIYQPSLAALPSDSFELGPFSSSHFGLGDINQSFYFSPARATELIWGIGPSFNLPTATASALGSGKFSMARLRWRWSSRNHDRNPGAPAVVCGRPPGCEPAAAATLRQL